MADLEALRNHVITRVLRGDLSWPKEEAEPGAVLAAADQHGVAQLLYLAVTYSDQWPHWPPEVRTALHQRTVQESALELARKQELARLVAALNQEGIEPLLMKGTALAYLLYPRPFLRPRADADLLIPVQLRARAFAALTQEYYEPAPDAGGTLVRTQRTFRPIERHTGALPIDLHWQLNNSPLLAGALEYAAARQRAIPIPALGSAALAFSLPDALFHACVHRAAHTPFHAGGHTHGAGDPLIWLYDIHLLAGRMSEGDWAFFTREAASQRVRDICWDALESARFVLGTALPESWIARLKPGRNRQEHSMALLSGSRWKVAWAELAVLPNWRRRVQYLREHLLPSPDHMARKYGTQRKWLLPLLYVRRAGAWLLGRATARS